MSVKLNLLRKLVRELIKKELEEASMTGNIDGGAGPPKTPKAFKKKKKNQDESGFQDGHEDPTVSTTYKKVKEAIQLSQGMKLGKVFTGHGKSFVKEEVEPAGNMAKIQKIVKDSQATKLGGVMIDMQSANLLMKVYNAVSDKDKEKMNKLNPKVLTRVIEKLWSRVKLKLPI